MSLFTATLLTGLLMLGVGSTFALARPKLRNCLVQSLRSDRAALIVLAIAGSWFLFKITQWGEADFGNYKHIAFAVFLGLGILAWFHLRDFLVVRAGSALVLMCAHALLNAAYMHYEAPSRLIMVSLVYAGIILALLLAAYPYRARDFLNWVFNGSLRARILGSVCAAYGIVLCAVAITY